MTRGPGKKRSTLLDCLLITENYVTFHIALKKSLASTSWRHVLYDWSLKITKINIYSTKCVQVFITINLVYFWKFKLQYVINIHLLPLSEGDMAICLPEAGNIARGRSKGLYRTSFDAN